MGCVLATLLGLLSRVGSTLADSHNEKLARYGIAGIGELDGLRRN
jgi:hypothetical protein